MISGVDFELLHKEKPKNEPARAIMLFHGLTGSPFEMKKYGTRLYKSGYDVYCYSLPGHGNFADAIETVTYKDWIDFAQNNYDRLRPQYDEFSLSGLCLGAVISVHLAQKNPDVTAVVALSTTLFLDGWTMPWYNFLMPLGLNTIVRYFYTFPEREPYGIKNESVRKKIAVLMSKTNVAMDNYPLCCVWELLKLSKEVQKDIKMLSCPLLAVHSKEDDLTSVKSARFIFDNCSSTKKEYIELENSYHMVLYDFERELVFDKAKEFLGRVSCEATCC